MRDEYFYNNNGVLSDADIQREMKNGNIFIAPFMLSQLQPSGYNLTPTKFFYSTTKKKFLTIIENEEETYVMIDRNDTVLVRTRESVAVSCRLTGAFYSKVKVVSEGFGHVSTTLDPNWEGQLLISLNNPTNRKLKFSIEKNVYGKKICNSFVTLEFMYLNESALNISDNPPGRLDILDSTIESNVSTFKKQKIEDLVKLVQQLHQQEKETIDYLTIKQLNADEKKEWEQIGILTDDEAYYIRKADFMKAKKEKYLRLIQREFSKNAEKSIEIINKYVEKKQKYLPLEHRCYMFLKKHFYALSGLMIAAVCIVLIIMAAIKSGRDGEQYNISFYTITFSIVIYIVFPMLRSIQEYFNNRIN